MNGTRRIAVIPLGMSLGVFLVITYALCVLYGLIWPAEPMHQLLPMLLPGFSWITWPSFVIGLAWAFAYARRVPAFIPRLLRTAEVAA